MPRKNETRGKVIQAAVQAFSSRGYAKTTMDEIALAAGVAKGSLYYNFPSKAKLFESIYEKGYEVIRKRIHAAISTDESSSTIIVNVIRILAEVFLEFPNLTGVLFYSIPSELDRETYQAVHSIREKFITLMRDLIREGQQEGMVKVLDPDLTASGLLALTLIVCLRVSRESEESQGSGTSPDARRREEAIDLISELVLNGILQTG